MTRSHAEALVDLMESIEEDSKDYYWANEIAAEARKTFGMCTREESENTE